MAIGTRDRKALQLGVAALALWAVLDFAVLPTWDRWQDQRRDLALREVALVKYRQAIAASGTEQKSADALAQRLRSMESGLLQSATPALAAAELQQWVRDTAAAHGIEVRSIEFQQTKPEASGYTHVPVGLEFQCHVDQLADFLADVRSGPKLLAVPRFQVQSTGGADKVVTVAMTIAGTIRVQ